MKRETGYYWVKMLPETWVGNKANWEVCYYDTDINKFYSTAYHNVDFSEHEIVEINETRILNPDEKNGDRNMVEKFDLEFLKKYDKIFADKKPDTRPQLNDVDIAKILMEKFSFNDLVKDGKVMDGSFDITVRELLEIIKHFR